MSLRSLKAKLLKVTDAVKLLGVTGNYKHIGKTNITATFQQVYEESKSFATVKNGFRRTGLNPCNPKTIHKTSTMPTATITSIPEIIDPITNTDPNSRVFLHHAFLEEPTYEQPLSNQ